MKIATHEVKNVTRDGAEVGCTKVTKAEVEALLEEMKKVPVAKDFEITLLPGDASYLNFIIRHQGTGWVGVSENQEAFQYSFMYGNKSAGFCLERTGKAEKLLRFLAEQLGYTVTAKESGKYIVELLGGDSNWMRSSNAGGVYSFEEATRLSKSQNNELKYRVTPAPAA